MTRSGKQYPRFLVYKMPSDPELPWRVFLMGGPSMFTSVIQLKGRTAEICWEYIIGELKAFGEDEERWVDGHGKPTAPPEYVGPYSIGIIR